MPVTGLSATVLMPDRNETSSVWFSSKRSCHSSTNVASARPCASLTACR